MNQIRSRNADRSAVNLVQFRKAQSYGVISMRAPRGKHSFLFSFEFGRRYLWLFVVVVAQAYVENEHQPDVAVVFKAVQATGWDLVDQGESSPRILDEATLPWRPKFLTIDWFQKANWPDNEGCIKLIYQFRLVHLVGLLRINLFLLQSDLNSVGKLWLWVWKVNVDEAI